MGRAGRILFLLTLFSVPGTAETRYTEGVLSSTSDALGCEAQPAPTPAFSRRPDSGTQGTGPVDGAPVSTSSCTDLGSTYQIAAGGRLFGLRRTSSDVRREAATLAVGNTSNSGVLAFQATGTHVLLSTSGAVAIVKLGQRQSMYTVFFVR